MGYVKDRLDIFNQDIAGDPKDQKVAVSFSHFPLWHRLLRYSSYLRKQEVTEEEKEERRCRKSRGRMNNHDCMMGCRVKQVSPQDSQSMAKINEFAPNLMRLLEGCRRVSGLFGKWQTQPNQVVLLAWETLWALRSKGLLNIILV